MLIRAEGRGRRWAKVMAVLVTVGAVSGTVLSFDMGLLWPGLMGTYGAAIGIPFSFEGIFFLLEAVFTAIYLYGWDRLPPWAHFWSLVPVAITGIGGALSVVAANSWMNDPAGFTVAHGRITSVDPVAVFFNGATYYWPSWPPRRYAGCGDPVAGTHRAPVKPIQAEADVTSAKGAGPGIS